MVWSLGWEEPGEEKEVHGLHPPDQPFYLEDLTFVTCRSVVILGDLHASQGD